MSTKILRPADSRNQPLPERPAAPATAPTEDLSQDWIDAYDSMSAYQAREMAKQSPEFDRKVDLLNARRSK